MNTLRPLSQVPLLSTTDQVFDRMYRAIIKLELPPGTKVSEAEIASQLGVSRQPVRDAFFRLSEKGFLSIRPQRATLITKISEKAVREAVFVRVALEVACAVRASRLARPAELADLRKILSQQKAANERGDREGFHDLDDFFHRRICEIAGHGHVWTLIREQKAHMDRVRYLTLKSNAPTAYEEHVRIAAAIESGDPDGAEETLQAHLSGILKQLPAMRAEHEQYFEGP